MGGKWVHTVKTNPEDKCKRFKSSSVAQGFSQVKGLNYQETFAPVLYKVLMLALLILAAKNNWGVGSYRGRAICLPDRQDTRVYLYEHSSRYKDW